MKAWWNERTLRERWLVGSAAGLLALALAFQFALMPSYRAREAARSELTTAERTQQRLSELIAAGVQPAAPPLAGTPAELRSQLLAWASEGGLGEAPSGPEASADLTFSFAEADPARVFAWIERAERSGGLRITAARLSASPDGRITSQITLVPAAAP
jgi:general secretion pathway protein M